MQGRRGSRAGLIVVGIVIFLLVGVIAVILVLTLGGGGTANQTGTQTSGQTGGQPSGAPQVTTVKIIVAAHDIRRGTRLTDQDVTAMTWPLLPNAPLPANTLMVGETPDQPGLEQVNGRVTRVDILENQPVLSNMITPADQPVELAATGSDAALLIPAGKLAVALPINRLSSVAYTLRSGDHVDILMSYRFIDVDKDFQTKLPNGITTFSGGTGYTQSPSASAPLGIDTQGREEKGPLGTQVLVVPSETDQRPRQSTQLMISNAVVLRMGLSDLSDSTIIVTSAPASSGGPTPTPEAGGGGAAATAVPPTEPDIITLIMSRQDALVLKYSLEVGASIDLGLRSVYDNTTTDVKTDGVTLQYLFDYYNLPEPPKLPLGFDPSIDVIVNPLGNFQQSVPSAPPAKATPPSQ